MPRNWVFTKILTFIYKFKSINPDCRKSNSIESSSPPPIFEDGSEKKCYYCRGLGVIIEKPYDNLYEDRGIYGHFPESRGAFRETTICPICKGNGYVNKPHEE